MRARVAILLAGVATLAAAPLVPGDSLAGHMIEHSLLVAVGVPLCVLASPVSLLLRTLGPRGRAGALAVLRSRPLAAVTHPATAWSLFVVGQWALHSPPLLLAAESSAAVHAAAHLSLLATAALFWLPAIGREPLPHRLPGPARSLYLFLAIPAVDLVAVALMVRGEEVAGAAMLAGMLPVAVAAIAVTWRWVSREERRVARAEGAYGGAR